MISVWGEGRLLEEEGAENTQSGPHSYEDPLNPTAMPAQTYDGEQGGGMVQMGAALRWLVGHTMRMSNPPDRRGIKSQYLAAEQGSQEEKLQLTGLPNPQEYGAESPRTHCKEFQRGDAAAHDQEALQPRVRSQG